MFKPFIINTIDVNGHKKTKKELENLTFDQNNIKINFCFI